MLTPSFEINQDDDFVVIHIKAPFTKVSETEIFFQDFDFKFYSKPYFLRLNLPGKVEENGKEAADYDADTGFFSIKLPKVTPGEWFEGLDLLTKLLATKTKPTTSGPLIEVIGGSTAVSDADDEFDWQIDQIPWTIEDEAQLQLLDVKYGFANQYSGALLRLKEEISEVIDLCDPDHKPSHKRHEERIHADAENFSDDHYLADLYQDETIKRLLELNPPWKYHYKKIKSNSHYNPDDIVHFTDIEMDKMRKLPNKEYLVDKQTKHMLLLGLVDILFGYAYNFRSTEGENTVESSWTICKLSASLSWLETFSSLESTLISGIRRSLCYPLYRHWGLAMAVLQDVKQILCLGVKYVLKCLLEIHTLFNGGDNYYILNNLYITDYCVWIQSVRSVTLITLGEALEKVNIQKKDVNLDLEELEQGAFLAIQENISSENISSTEENIYNLGATSSDHLNGMHRAELHDHNACIETVQDIQLELELRETIYTTGDESALNTKLEQMKLNDPIISSQDIRVNCQNSANSSEENEMIAQHSGMSNISSSVVSTSELSQNSSSDVSESDSDSSSFSESDDSSETDSDDYSSSSSDSCTDESDYESSDTEYSDENASLLKRDKSFERKR